MTTMTEAATARLLLILAEGPHSVEQLARESGMTVKKVRSTIRDLAVAGHIYSIPVHYAITPSGIERAMWTPADHKARKNASQRKRRREERAARGSIPRPPNPAVDITSIPNSVFALGDRA